MRNSHREHNQHLPRNSRLAPRWAIVVLLYPLALLGSGEIGLSREDVVAIHADQAWEDLEPETIRFEGHFEMRSQDWRVTADRATLHGKLDNPESLTVKGAPARFETSLTQGNRTERVLAEAQEIVYERDSRLIHLNGDARLVQGDNLLRSSSVEYNIKTGRFRAEGEAGVQIRAETKAPGA